MQPGVFLFAAVPSSASAFLAEGKTVTLSLTVSEPDLFWNCGLLTDGGFSLISETATPMQCASCASPTVVFGLLGAFVLSHPDGMSESTRRDLRAWASSLAPDPER